MYAHGADETNPSKVCYAFTVDSFSFLRHVADHKTQEARRFGMLVMTRREGDSLVLEFGKERVEITHRRIGIISNECSRYTGCFLSHLGHNTHA